MNAEAMKAKRILALLAFGILACEDGGGDSSGDAVGDAVDDSDTGQSDLDDPADIDPEPPLVSTPEPTDSANIRAIDMIETDVTLKLVARDIEMAVVGVMILEHRELEQLDIDGPALEETWYPVHADGFFDVTGLDDEQVEERVLTIRAFLGEHQASRVVWCAMRIAAAAWMCSDGPAFVLTCPVGLHAMICECGPQVGIPKERLEAVCGE
jgi:hypothetical protein